MRDKIPIRDGNGKLSRTYRKWLSMKQRCYNPRHPAFKYYDGKGIEVCDRWRGRGGYQNFIQDLGEAPAGLTLERKDKTKGYCLDNCRWATWKDQAANRKKRGPSNDWTKLATRARAAGLDYNLVTNRIRMGWSEEKALTTPKQPRGNLCGLDAAFKKEFGERPGKIWNEGLGRFI
jgi:hypothetical protein